MTKEAKELVPEAVGGIKGSIEQWQLSTENNRLKLEKELSAIQNSLAELEQSIADQQK